MTLTECRRRCRRAARNAQDTTNYTNAQIDDGLDRLLGQFLRVTRSIKTSTTVSMTASTNLADFSSLAAFRASRIERMRLVVDANYTRVKSDLADIGIARVMEKLTCGETTTGVPCEIGFLDSTSAKLWPAPQYNGTITVVYAPLQTPWTSGTRGAYSSSLEYVPDDIVSSAGSLYRAIITNTNVAVATGSTWESLGTGTLTGPDSVTPASGLPDGLLTELITAGIVWALQSTDPKQKPAAQGEYQKYLAFESACMGIGSIGGHSSQAERA